MTNYVLLIEIALEILNRLPSPPSPSNPPLLPPSASRFSPFPPSFFVLSGGQPVHLLTGRGRLNGGSGGDASNGYVQHYRRLDSWKGGVSSLAITR